MTVSGISQDRIHAAMRSAVEVADANMAMERSFDAMMAADASGKAQRLKKS